MLSKMLIKSIIRYLTLYLILLSIVISISDCCVKKTKSYKEFQLSILKDSLLINKLGYLDINLSKKDIDKIEIIPISAYRLKYLAKNYSLESNFKDFIELERNRIDGYIYFKNQAIGYIQAFYDGKSWNIFGGVQALKPLNPKKTITNLLSKSEIENLYVVISLDGLWIERGGNTYVYNFYLDKPEFVLVKDYVYKTITKEALIYVINQEGYFP